MAIGYEKEVDSGSKPAVPTEPEVTITATASTVSEGNPVSFTLTAVRPPASL